MLSLAKAHKDYYLQKVGEILPREAYYLRGGRASGRWHGCDFRWSLQHLGESVSWCHPSESYSKPGVERPGAVVVRSGDAQRRWVEQVIGLPLVFELAVA
jgi:hypothetical protein